MTEEEKKAIKWLNDMPGVDVSFKDLLIYRETLLNLIEKQQQEIQELISENIGYQCFHCGRYTVSWDSDFDTEDYGYDAGGIVHECHCSNCGADITYIINSDKEE